MPFSLTASCVWTCCLNNTLLPAPRLHLPLSVCSSPNHQSRLSLKTLCFLSHPWVLSVLWTQWLLPQGCCGSKWGLSYSSGLGFLRAGPNLVHFLNPISGSCYLLSKCWSEWWVSARFGSTYTKIGTIQRRLAWPLCKDDTQICEAFHIFTHGCFISMYDKIHYNIKNKK